jgi:hypothetical protein
VPADGSVSLSNEDRFDSIATYKCDTGFKLTGGNERSCLNSASWSGKSPECEGKGHNGRSFCIDSLLLCRLCIVVHVAAQRC